MQRNWHLLEYCVNCKWNLDHHFEKVQILSRIYLVFYFIFPVPVPVSIMPDNNNKDYVWLFYDFKMNSFINIITKTLHNSGLTFVLLVKVTHLMQAASSKLLLWCHSYDQGTQAYKWIFYTLRHLFTPNWKVKLLIGQQMSPCPPQKH